MRRIILTGSLLMAMSLPSMAAQVYKWVDSNGVTHFSAQPPEDQSATSISTTIKPPKSGGSVAPLPKLDSQLEAEQQKATDDKVKREVAEQESKRKQYCSDLRENLSQLRLNPRVRVEENGEIRRLSAEERQARITEAEKNLQENCR